VSSAMVGVELKLSTRPPAHFSGSDYGTSS
jgi:hypothetical protein